MRLFVCVCALLIMVSAASAAPFSDVPRSHWAYEAIQKTVDAGVLQGFDGKFEGARLLNRYQMAVVVAKLLDGVKAAPAGTLGTSDETKKMLGNLEALTIEFADELALLNVKVATLEDSFQELKGQCGAAPVAAPAAGGLGFTAFASFALIDTDEQSNGAYIDGDVLASDSLYFDMPQVSLGVDKEVNPGVFFHAQFDFNAYVNQYFIGGSAVSVNEAYFFVDEIFGDIGGKVGAFALPFSMEHNGPFRTCNYTITPSVVNSFFEGVRGYGMEFQKTKDVQAGDIAWKFGVMSGTDFGGLASPTAGNVFNTVPVALGQGEGDDGFGFYIMIDKKPTENSAFGWNLSYFDNGGDNTASTDGIHNDSPEVDLFNLGLTWSNDDFLVLAQYADGSIDTEDFTAFYFLVNFKIDEKQSVSLRYDDATLDDIAGAEIYAIDAITFAYNRKVTENSMFQLEYLTPNLSAGGTDQDIKDDVFQIRYKVHF